MDSVKNVGCRIFNNSWETQIDGCGLALVKGEELSSHMRKIPENPPHQDQNPPLPPIDENSVGTTQKKVTKKN